MAVNLELVIADVEILQKIEIMLEHYEQSAKKYLDLLEKIDENDVENSELD
ncbi:MAG: hypothetical protein ACOYIF_02390 [Acetivibrionales bacterium]|jgi:hypothetical protein